MVDTLSKADPSLKTIGAYLSQNNSNISSRNECKKYGANKSVHNQGDYTIVSHQKSMFLVQYHLGKEEVKTTMVAAPALKHIGDSRSQITYDKSSRKQCEREGADKPLHDEVDDAISSHQISIFLFQSHLVQEKRQTKMVDNVSMAPPTQVTQNTT